MEPNGARYVGRFSFPLAGRYQLAVAGQRPQVTDDRRPSISELRHDVVPAFRTVDSEPVDAGGLPPLPLRQLDDGHLVQARQPDVLVDVRDVAEDHLRRPALVLSRVGRGP